MKYERICNDEGCKEHALYPAPKSNKKLDEYVWFCIRHIREYNKNWNYFRDMSEGEIVAEMEMGERRQEKSDLISKDRTSILYSARSNVESSILCRILSKEIISDLRTMRLDLVELSDMVDIKGETEEIYLELLLVVKMQYKELVKDIHPDIPGVEDHGEEFKLINEAYRNLQGVFSRSK